MTKHCPFKDYTRDFHSDKTDVIDDPWDVFEDIKEACPYRADYLTCVLSSIITHYGERDELLACKDLDYWTQGEKELLKALIYLVARDKSFEGERTFEEDLVNASEADRKGDIFKHIALASKNDANDIILELIDDIMTDEHKENQVPGYWDLSEQSLLHALIYLVSRDPCFENERSFESFKELAFGPASKIRYYLENSSSETKSRAVHFLQTNERIQNACILAVVERLEKYMQKGGL